MINNPYIHNYCHIIYYMLKYCVLEVRFVNQFDLEKYVVNLLGSDCYNKGKRYRDYYVHYMGDRRLERDSYIHTFSVESERYYMHYPVRIFISGNNIINYSCGCKAFKTYGRCKHVAACILKYPDELFKEPVDPLEISNSILENFYDNTSKSNKIKEALTLKIELEIDNNYHFRLHIGKTKTYVINNRSKFNDFLIAYDNNETYEFGKQFTYDPSSQFFNIEDEEMLNFFRASTNAYNYYNSGMDLSEREFLLLLDKLKNRSFLIKNYGIVNEVIKGMPTELSLDLKDDIYHLNINNFEKYHFLDDSYRYIAYNHVLYIVPSKYCKILAGLRENDLDEIVFKKESEEVFKNGLLKQVRNNIKISSNIKDIVIGSKPDISLYFDFIRNKIKCRVELDYNDKKIDYFINDDTILRDEEAENKLVENLYQYHFEVENNNFILDDMEDVGYFLDEGIHVLSNDYKIFTSKKIDDITIVKKSNIKSNFSIGTDGIMSYSFDTDNINLDELNDVLSSLKNKKRYYKLKSGNIIDLNNNEELKNLNSLINDLDINGKDLLGGNVEIPKYRAFYIDSLRKNRYKDINTDNSFDTFINNFKKYKNVDIELTKKDEKLLRDYQKDGIKWLYTLYKCDLGGILADEMGLGKSIQTIMFIKMILKEKKDAKILIVCPTSLVYNWKKEFDKFGSELKYITVADNKVKRKEVFDARDNYNIFITSYGLVRNDNDEYEHINFELCVIDEAQAIKNYQAGMTKEIKKIKARTKIALTGTPLENNVSELWSIFDFIMPGYLNSVTKFNSIYGIKDVDEESMKKLDNLNYQIKPFILRRKKKDVTKDLPEKIENTVYLDLPDVQKALYLKVLNESKEEIDELIATDGFKKARFKILQLLMKLRQICIEPRILYSNYKGESIKFEKLLEIVNDYVKDGHKILLFSSFKMVIDRVKTMLDKNKISSYMIDGSVKGKVRMELVDKFNSDDTSCFLITLKSGGTGLNLTSADIVIHLDIWWNPQVENQATDRAHRIGQKNKVTVVKLVTKGTIEERIIELQNKKKILSENLIEGKSSTDTLSSLSEDDIKDLLSRGEDE